MSSVFDQAYVRQADIARELNCHASTVGRMLKKKGVKMTCFGYLADDVIEALNLHGYLERMKNNENCNRNCGQ